MGFRCCLRGDTIVGSCLAFAFVAFRSGNLNLITAGRYLRLRAHRWFNFVERIWFKPAQRTSLNIGHYRHAIGVVDPFAGLAHLAKNPQRRALELTRPMVGVCFVNGVDVDQRADRICVFASGNRRLGLARAQR